MPSPRPTKAYGLGEWYADGGTSGTGVANDWGGAAAHESTDRRPLTYPGSGYYLATSWPGGATNTPGRGATWVNRRCGWIVLLADPLPPGSGSFFVARPWIRRE